MILVFAGAGASKSVDAGKYPTTVEFMDGLPASIQSSQLFVGTQEFLAGDQGPEAVVDVEQMLWVLDELQGYLAECAKPSETLKWFIDRSVHWSGADLKSGFNKLQSQAPRALTAVNQLTDALHRQVYEAYCDEPEEAELQGNWLSLLPRLAESDSRVELFTTNYDLVIESAIDILERSGYPARFETGRIGHVTLTLDSGIWSSGLPPQKGSLGFLTKLHGSVDWSRKEDRVYLGDPYFKGDHARHAILYPGFKGTPTEPPFTYFHDHFERVVQQADRLLFIGFAFRDEHLNSILSKNIRDDARIVALDPVKRLSHSPFPAKRLDHVRSTFSREGIAQAAHRLGISHSIKGAN